MPKHLVFFHQTFPAQFGPIMNFMVQEHGAQVSFFSEYISKPIPQGIRHYQCGKDQTGLHENNYFFSRYFEEECRMMYGVYQAVEAARLTSPDIFIGHVGFGNLMMLHVAYPEIPSVGFFEIFYDPFKADTYCRPEYPVPLPNIIRMPIRNATQLLELEYCTRGYSPTPFQRSTYPTAYRDKLATLFDGIDTNLYQPGEVRGDSELPRTWPADAKIVTFVARGLESFRGFDLFMEAAYQVSQKRKDVHFVIAGNPKTHYGPEMISLKEHQTFKDYVMKQHPYDLSRFHFLNWISEPALVDLFRLSDLHVYWTIPFTLSWSFFQSLSTGCIVLASNSDPVRDVLIDGENGLLVEPYNLDDMVQRVLEVLDGPEKYAPLRKAARETILTNYSLDVCLPRLAEFYLTGKVLPAHSQLIETGPTS